MYTIKITYLDDKVTIVNVDVESYETFINALTNREMFWGKEGKNGFWTNMDQIRYVQTSVSFPVEEDNSVNEEHTIEEDHE